MTEASLVLRDVCAWPVLIRLHDGSLGIVHFNRPSHGLLEGGLEAIASNDDGGSWRSAGVAAPENPGENRMHIAAGLDHAGTWIVLSTGFSLVDGALSELLRPWCSHKPADAQDWEVDRAVRIDSPLRYVIPHGRILALADGRLAASVYQSEGRNRRSRACVVFSKDAGRTWGEASVLGEDANEVCLLELEAGTLLAASRTHADHHVTLHRSANGGKTWAHSQDLTLPMQHPADLIALTDAQLLLTYGIRNRGLMGIGARLSRDGGSTWGAPAVLYQFGEATDCGYPSTAICADGSLLTACYSDCSPLYEGYHLLTIRWALEDYFQPRPLRSISDGRALEV